MSDNTTLDAGSGGDVIATDDCSGVKYQVVKLADGTADATTVIKAGGGVEANALRVTIASDSTGVVSVDDNGSSITVDNGGTFAVQATLAAGATNIAKAEDVASADADVGVPAMAVRKATPANTSGTDGDYEMLQMSGGYLWVNASGQTLTVASHAVTNAGTFAVQAAQSGTWTVQPGNTANTTAWLTQNVAATSGGLSFNGFVGAASNNKTQIKGSAGMLYLVSVQNLASTPVYLKVFNNTSAGVTAGTTACDFQFLVPGNTAGAGIVLDSDIGIAMGTGITIMLTAAIATTDNTSVSANQQVVLIGYK